MISLILNGSVKSVKVTVDDDESGPYANMLQNLLYHRIKEPIMQNFDESSMRVGPIRGWLS